MGARLLEGWNLTAFVLTRITHSETERAQRLLGISLLSFEVPQGIVHSSAYKVRSYESRSITFQFRS